MVETDAKLVQFLQVRLSTSDIVSRSLEQLGVPCRQFQFLLVRLIRSHLALIAQYATSFFTTSLNSFWFEMEAIKARFQFFLVRLAGAWFD